MNVQTVKVGRCKSKRKAVIKEGKMVINLLDTAFPCLRRDGAVGMRLMTEASAGRQEIDSHDSRSQGFGRAVSLGLGYRVAHCITYISYLQTLCFVCCKRVLDYIADSTHLLTTATREGGLRVAMQLNLHL